MKKWLPLLWAALLCLTSSACAGQAAGPASPSPDGASPSAPSSQAGDDADSPSDWQTVLREYPAAVQLEQEDIYDIYPIEGDSQGFLIFTGTNIQPGSLYYCQGDTGECSLLYQDFPSSELTAGRISPDLLQVTWREGIFRWDEDGLSSEWSLPEEKQFDFSYHYGKDALFWVDSLRGDLRYGEWDSQGTVLWPSTLEENNTPYPSIDEDGSRVASRAAAPRFSESGRLAFFLEHSAPYQVRPVLYDLESGEAWAEEDFQESPAVCAYMIGETGVMTCYSQEDGQGWNKIKTISLDGPEELELDFFYIRSYPGEDRLYLEDKDGSLYRFDLQTRQSEPIYQAAYPGISVRTVVGTSKLEALLLTDTRSGSTAVIIITR